MVYVLHSPRLIIVITVVFVYLLGIRIDFRPEEALVIASVVNLCMIM